MPYLAPKPKQAQAWIPSQVTYGVDCSDPDPEKWIAFGSEHEKGQAETAKHTSKVKNETS